MAELLLLTPIEGSWPLGLGPWLVAYCNQDGWEIVIWSRWKKSPTNQQIIFCSVLRTTYKTQKHFRNKLFVPVEHRDAGHEGRNGREVREGGQGVPALPPGQGAWGGGETRALDPHSVPLVGVDPDYGIDDRAKYLGKIIERRETRKVIITRSYDRMAPLGQVLRRGR